MYSEDQLQLIPNHEGMTGILMCIEAQFMKSKEVLDF